MTNRFAIYSAFIAALAAPYAAGRCEVAGGQADQCGNLNEVPGALAQMTVATSTSLTTSSALSVPNPYGGEFIERWPGQRPWITFVVSK